MEWQNLHVRVKPHAIERAWKRGLSPGGIERIIQNGRMERFGKNGVKFVGKKFVLIARVEPMRLNIITVVKRES
jgi:hypothetical protein